MDFQNLARGSPLTSCGAVFLGDILHRYAWIRGLGRIRQCYGEWSACYSWSTSILSSRVSFIGETVAVVGCSSGWGSACLLALLRDSCWFCPASAVMLRMNAKSCADMLGLV